ncbi:MAG: hypothetical protein DMG60_06115 [Acidobacteria bacterium]|nr:MAG: hypothetical protein DMG60_06115 [Acidobacteriota bacterium]
MLECGDSLLSPFLSGDDSFSGTEEMRKITLLQSSARKPEGVCDHSKHYPILLWEKHAFHVRVSMSLRFCPSERNGVEHGRSADAVGTVHNALQ